MQLLANIRCTSIPTCVLVGDGGHVIFSFDNYVFSFEMSRGEWWDVMCMCALHYKGEPANCGVNLDGTNYNISQTADDVNLTVKSDNTTYIFSKDLILPLFDQITSNNL